MKKRIAISVLLSVAVLLLSYIAGNSARPLAGEKSVLVKLNSWKTMLGLAHDSVPDDVLLVNVAYDKMLVDYTEDGLPIGQETITDRRKLLEFLTKAREADNYKFIMMDVILEQGITTEYDSALFHAIAQMPRIVIPVHADAPLQDSILYPKAANADYNITHDETNFCRFQFMHDSMPTMPLVMYAEKTGLGIKRQGMFYTSGGRLCRNGMTLKLPVRISGAYMDRNEATEDTEMLERSFLYLGADILAVDSVLPVAEQISDKIVVIGDFNNDVHRTYMGYQPGSVICLNAYYALLRGEHLINWWFVLFLFFVYAGIAMLILNGKSIDAFFTNPWLKATASFFAFTVVFTLIAMIVYALPVGMVYNPVMPTTVFTTLGVIKNAIKKVRG
ncbi:MAG: CHASE2 domain-containing protein [Prevotella sp.]|nr:CHASE2 domain-containing protein [Prevotella sp.]